VAVIDPALVSDAADYDAPRTDAIGIDDVFVGGQSVLAGGQLTGATSGRGLRRSAPVK
jgi:N-acyl-D-amino-acid deacylase